MNNEIENIIYTTNDNTKVLNDLKDTILKEYEKGNIVFADIEGFKTVPLAEFIKQPVDGILYDLNRLEEVVLTWMDEKRWINDYAVVKVIRAMAQEINDLRGNK